MSELTLFASSAATVEQVKNAVNTLGKPDGVDWINVDETKLTQPDMHTRVELSKALGVFVLNEDQFFDAIDAAGDLDR